MNRQITEFQGDDYMSQIQFVYSKNRKRKSDLDEHKRRCEIMEHNKKLCEEYPLFKSDKSNNKI